MIDLRSDTVTRPTGAMREAIARAPVGDDVYGDDPTVRELEARVAEVLGLEAAVYMPTGTMTNQVAIRAQTEPGDAVFVGPAAHVWLGEAGAPSPISGVVVRSLPGERGGFVPEALADVLPVEGGYAPQSLSAPARLVCLENTHNGAGGTIWPLETQRAVVDLARERGLATHLDGARLWHATAATGISEREYADGFDTVSVCFSKGLGAPMGSVLAATSDLIGRARRFKQLYGGGFRQAGMMAAGALYALENHRARLVEDHRRARNLAEGMCTIPGLSIDPEAVETNILRFRTEGIAAPRFATRCRELGLSVLACDRMHLRAVLHLDIDDSDVEESLRIMREAAQP